MKTYSRDKLVNFLIAGDSWGLGEWDDTSTITHKGLEQFLLDAGHSVRNISAGGASNSRSIATLSKDLDSSRLKDDTIVLWIQTDPSRDLFALIHENSLTEEVAKHQSIVGVLDYFLDNNYKELDSIGRKHNIDIYLVGGLYPIQPMASNYEHLITLVPSWFTLFVNRPYNIVKSISIQDISLHKLELQLAEKIIEEMSKLREDEDILRSHPIFELDKFHPNRYGHYFLYNALLNLLFA